MARILQRKSIPAGFLTLLGMLLPAKTFAQSQDKWIDSRPLLQAAPRPEATQDFLFVKTLYGAVTRSLLNPEQHRQLLDLQARTGTRPLDPKPRALSIHKLTLAPTTAPTEITKSVGSYIGREFKSSAMPDVMRTGFNFELGKKSETAGPIGPAPVRYGLILTSVEPSAESFKLASIPGSAMDDYELVTYAPKAKVHYAVGPLPMESDLAQAESPLSWASGERQSWTNGLPDLQFRGKIIARGAPTASQVLPPQSIFLEQTQGFYSLEIQTSNVLHKDAVFHRTRVPLMGSLCLREERNDRFKKTRSTLENIYARGPLALNLDYFGLEKRYQTGLIYQKSLTRIELYNHLPQSGEIWKQQRYELRVQTGF